jgi:hypothetical protein
MALIGAVFENPNPAASVDVVVPEEPVTKPEYRKPVREECSERLELFPAKLIRRSRWLVLNPDFRPSLAGFHPITFDHSRLVLTVR